MIRTKELFTVTAAVWLLWGCFNENSEKDSGEKLSQQYCSGCHLRPDPSLLPKSIWGKSVLPAMGAFADIYKDKTGQYKILPASLLTTRDPAIENVRWNISMSEWEKIVEYYTSQAPNELPVPTFQGGASKELFNIRPPKTSVSSHSICVFFDEKSKLLFQSSLHDGKVNIYDRHGKLQFSIENCFGVVQIAPLPTKEAESSEYLLTHIGTFNPGKGKKGFIEKITIKQGRLTHRQTLISDLHRPVQTLAVDLEKSGHPDIVVCEFGFMEGQLSLFSLKQDGNYSKSIILEMAGASVVYADDINQDGLIDLWVLFASGKEGIYQFINRGTGGFEQKNIMEFPPSYGSTYFELVDFDNDGLKDIAYTCGDNADMSQVLKPYHGFYLYKNTGNGYHQSFFKHINGCYKALPADFNRDGNLDWAIISFFADYEKSPQEGFLYLLNDGNGNYSTHYPLSDTTKSGRWICLDVKDINSDKVPDVIIGNMVAMPAPNTPSDNWAPYLILESKNNIKN